jgi:hypothetical protein
MGFCHVVLYCFTYGLPFRGCDRDQLKILPNARSYLR